ncbi:uncharacterized protein LOC133201219 [Saccostrea echinata]|uniref:uncharacterized protein LOC133201219 n=1 Tax=Saccostrea echinata TaxID=191078 RepID=UPI002A7F856A|nr:uncharacterized protein LOC133201219 [Saccostrea echinata]
MDASLKQQFTSDLILKDDSISDRWNRFFIKYDCCSVHQVTSTTNDFDTTPWCTTSGSCQQTNSQIPKACCKDVTEDDYINAAASCHATVTSGTYKDSCFARVKKLNDEALTEKEVDDFFTGLIIMEASKTDTQSVKIPSTTQAKRLKSNQAAVSAKSDQAAIDYQKLASEILRQQGLPNFSQQ